MAHKKGQGSVRNGRDSNAKRLGVKKYAGERVTTGTTLIKQRGTKWHPGKHVKRAKDDTLFALADGFVYFTSGGRIINVRPTYVERTAAPIPPFILGATAEKIRFERSRGAQRAERLEDSSYKPAQRLEQDTIVAGALYLSYLSKLKPHKEGGMPHDHLPKISSDVGARADSVCLGVKVVGGSVSVPPAFADFLAKRLITTPEGLIGVLRRSPSSVAASLGLSPERVVQERRAILDLFLQNSLVPADMSSEPAAMTHGTGYVFRSG